MESVKQIIRDIPDFPKEGIIFKDITPLLADASAFGETINALKKRYADKQIDRVVGVEARGFIFASALAYALGACLLYTSPSPRDKRQSRMPSSA